MVDLGMAGDLSEHYRAIMKRAITAILKNDIYELKNAFLSLENRQRRSTMLVCIRILMIWLENT